MPKSDPAFYLARLQRLAADRGGALLSRQYVMFSLYREIDLSLPQVEVFVAVVTEPKTWMRSFHVSAT